MIPLGIMGSKLDAFPVQEQTAAGVCTVPEYKEGRRSLKLHNTLPPGIGLGRYKDTRRRPWYVRHDGKTVPFATEAERNDYAERLAANVRKEGEEVLAFDPARWRLLLRIERETGLTLEQMRDLALAAKGAGQAGGLTVYEAAGRYLEARAAEGLAGDSLRHVRLAVTRFRDWAPNRPLVSISPDDVRAWLAHLGRTLGLSSLTLRHHRKDLRVFFKRTVAEGWRAGNPCEAVVPPRIESVDQTVLPVADAYKLLRANRDEPIAPLLALEMFGGLRCSSVERIRPEHLDMAGQGITMPAAAHKSGKRVFRQGHPATLWAWLALAGPATWAIPASMYDRRKADAFVRAGVRNPGNILRHSFASYLLAATKNPPAVGYLMQHRSTATTLGYEGVATERDAKLYLALTPCAVLLPWAELQARQKRC